MWATCAIAAGAERKRDIPGVTQVATYSTAVKTHMATLGVAYRFNGR